MASINEITSAAGYTGNAALGGYAAEAIVIDTKPLETLARYTMDFHESQYKQRQLDAEKTAAEMAEMAAFDFSQINEKWRKPISEKFDQLTKLVQNDPNVFNYQKNPKGYLEYKRLKAEVAQAVKNGGANQMLLEARQAKLSEVKDPAMRKLMQEDIDEDVANTGLDKKLRVEQGYQLSFKPIGDAAMMTTESFRIDKNTNEVTKLKLIDYGYINSQSLVAEMDMNNQDVSADDLAKIVDPTERKKAERQNAINAYNKQNGYMAMGQVLSDALKDPKFVGPDGKISMELLLKDSKTAPYAGLIDNYNRKMQQQLNELKSGTFDDKDGNKIIAGHPLMDEKNYIPINYQDGLNPAEITKIMMVANAKPEEKSVDLSHTGTQTSLDNNKLDASVALAGQRNALRIAREGDASAERIAKLPYEQIKLSADANAKTLTEQEYSPLASVAAAAGAVNKIVPLSSLSIAQVAAINPSYVDKETGQVAKEFKNLKISVGTQSDADGGTSYGVFIFKDGQTRGNFVNESAMLSNGASWLSTDGKERKGQDAYTYRPEALKKSLSTNAQSATKITKSSTTTTAPTVKEVKASDLAALAVRDGYTGKNGLKEYKALLIKNGVTIK